MSDTTDEMEFLAGRMEGEREGREEGRHKTWTDHYGRVLLISEMTTKHLLNVIFMLMKRGIYSPEKIRLHEELEKDLKRRNKIYKAEKKMYKARNEMYKSRKIK